MEYSEHMCYVRTEELEKKARELNMVHRRHYSKPEFLVSNPKQRKWGLVITPENLVALTIRRQEDLPLSDLETLHWFLMNNRKECFAYPISDNFSRFDLVPSFVPLLDFLAVDSERFDSWKYPNSSELKLFQNNRGVDMHSLQSDEDRVNVVVREIVVGSTTKEDMEELWKFFQFHHELDQSVFPGGAVSMVVEGITIPQADHDMLVKLRGTQGYHDTTDSLQPGESVYRLPVKILIGNGLRWLISITWPVEKLHKSRKIYRIWAPTPERELIDFLSDLPTSVGVSNIDDIPNIIKFYSIFSPNYPLEMRPWLSLSTLATACGWELACTNINALSFGLTGGLLDDRSFRADGEWCLPWSDLPSEFKIFAVGDIKLCYMAFIILTATLIRDTFPDPDSLGFISLDKPQFELTRKFCSYIVHSFRRLSVNEKLRADPETKSRIDLLNCIRERDEKTGLFLPGIPHGVKVWGELLQSWPALTQGGPRYLLQARIHIIHQYNVLTRSEKKGWENFFVPELTVSMIKYLSFGRSLESIKSCDFNDPVPIDEPGLLHHILLGPVGPLNPARVQVEDLERLAMVLQRSQEAVYYEWARLFSHRCVEIFERLLDPADPNSLNQNPLKIKGQLEFYEHLRLMFFRLTDKQPDLVVWIEVLLLGKLNKISQSEIIEFEEAKMMFEARQKRFNFLQNKIKVGLGTCRANIRLPDLPIQNPFKVEENEANQSSVKRKYENDVAPEMNILSPKRVEFPEYFSKDESGRRGEMENPRAFNSEIPLKRDRNEPKMNARDRDSFEPRDLKSMSNNSNRLEIHGSNFSPQVAGNSDRQDHEYRFEEKNRVEPIKYPTDNADKSGSRESQKFANSSFWDRQAYNNGRRNERFDVSELEEGSRVRSRFEQQDLRASSHSTEIRYRTDVDDISLLAQKDRRQPSIPRNTVRGRVFRQEENQTGSRESGRGSDRRQDRVSSDSDIEWIET